jgi:hypothetical protein
MTALAVQDRFRGALLGVAIGDALGAPFEGRDGPRPRKWCTGATRHPHVDRYAARFVFFSGSGAGSVIGGGFSRPSTVR